MLHVSDRSPKTSTIVALALLTLSCYLLPATTLRAEGQPSPVLCLVEINYPPGNKEGYLQWVRSIVDTLSAPQEVKRITSYDNYYSTQPHRLVVYEFDSMTAATHYWEREEIAAIRREVIRYGGLVAVKYFTRRGDYATR